MWKRTHFPLRDFIQQEVLNFSENRKSYRETSLDISSENNRDFPEEMTHQFILVFKVMKQSYDLYRPVIMKKGGNIFYYKFYFQSLLRKFVVNRKIDCACGTCI